MARPRFARRQRTAARRNSGHSLHLLPYRSQSRSRLTLPQEPASTMPQQTPPTEPCRRDRNANQRQQSATEDLLSNLFGPSGLFGQESSTSATPRGSCTCSSWPSSGLGFGWLMEQMRWPRFPECGLGAGPHPYWRPSSHPSCGNSFGPSSGSSCGPTSGSSCGTSFGPSSGSSYGLSGGGGFSGPSGVPCGLNCGCSHCPSGPSCWSPPNTCFSPPPTVQCCANGGFVVPLNVVVDLVMQIYPQCLRHIQQEQQQQQQHQQQHQQQQQQQQQQQAMTQQPTHPTCTCCNGPLDGKAVRVDDEYTIRREFRINVEAEEPADVSPSPATLRSGRTYESSSLNQDQASFQANCTNLRDLVSGLVQGPQNLVIPERMPGTYDLPSYTMSSLSSSAGTVQPPTPTATHQWTSRPQAAFYSSSQQPRDSEYYSYSTTQSGWQPGWQSSRPHQMPRSCQQPQSCHPSIYQSPSYHSSPQNGVFNRQMYQPPSPFQTQYATTPPNASGSTHECQQTSPASTMHSSGLLPFDLFTPPTFTFSRPDGIDGHRMRPADFEISISTLPIHQMHSTGPATNTALPTSRTEASSPAERIVDVSLVMHSESSLVRGSSAKEETGGEKKALPEVPTEIPSGTSGELEHLMAASGDSRIQPDGEKGDSKPCGDSEVLDPSKIDEKRGAEQADGTDQGKVEPSGNCAGEVASGLLALPVDDDDDVGACACSEHTLANSK